MNPFPPATGRKSVVVDDLDIVERHRQLGFPP